MTIQYSLTKSGKYLYV